MALRNNESAGSVRSVTYITLIGQLNRTNQLLLNKCDNGHRHMKIFPSFREGFSPLFAKHDLSKLAVRLFSPVAKSKSLLFKVIILCFKSLV